MSLEEYAEFGEPLRHEGMARKGDQCLTRGFPQIISHVGTAIMRLLMSINIAPISAGNADVYDLIVTPSVSNIFLT